METGHPEWRAPLLWRTAQPLARVVVGALARLEVADEIPRRLRPGPLLLAANHISPFDPIVLAAACHSVGIAPQIMATGGLFRAPLVGAAMRHAGHIRVDRGASTVGEAMTVAADALAGGAVILVYPEGRIGLDPGLWPERGKTGVARLALRCGVPVIPVAQWGAHEVLPYRTPKGLVRALARTVTHRRVVRVGFGAPVDLTDLTPDTPGGARRATDRIIDAITATLAPLRPDEPDRPRHVDPGRPVDTSRSHRRS